jgi:atypical dual specificity phosphatase
VSFLYNLKRDRMTTFLSQVAQITPNLFLSGFVGATESNVRKHNIKYIITVCKEIPKVNLPNTDSLKLDILDKPNENIDRWFDLVADKIKDVESRNGNCLVHCVAGISRSASMCIAYLMKHRAMTLRDAFYLVKSKRTFIRPNLGFWSQLVGYERKLFGQTSVKMIPCSIGLIPDVYENEFKNMIIPNSPASNDKDTKLDNSLSLSTASITLNNSQLKIPISPGPSSKKKPENLILTAKHPLPLIQTNQNRSTTYTTTYNSSYGSIIKR